MKRKILLSILFVAIMNGIIAQVTSWGYTIKATSANTVGIYVKPDASQADWKFGQIQFSVGYQTTCANPLPTQSFTIDPNFTAVYGGYTLLSPNIGTSTLPTGYSYTSWTLNNGPLSVPGPVTAGVEILLGTISFSNSLPLPSCPVYLLDFSDGGSNGNGSTYITKPGSTIYFTPTLGTATFYNGSGGYQGSTSTTSSDPGGVFPDPSIVQTNTNNSYATTSISVILPVTLISFTAAMDANCTSHLNWKVADAVNFSHFEIEYSTDGRNFNRVGNVNLTQDVTSYQYSYQQADATGYYRLKMVDNDGQYKYSNIVLLRKDCNGAARFTATVYPNPVVSGANANLLITTGQNSKVSVRVYDAAGKLMQAVQEHYINGSSNVQVSTDRWAKGIYRLLIQNENTGEKISLNVSKL